MKRNVDLGEDENRTNEIFMNKRLRYENVEELQEQHLQEDFAGDHEDIKRTTDVIPRDIILEENRPNHHDKKYNLYNIFRHSNETKMPPGAEIMASVCRTCGSSIDEEEAMVMISCQFCSHIGCSYCTPQCFSCGDHFCKNCSLQNYDSDFERTICIDCNCSYSSLKWSA
jgi:NAD-dependent DNA ligase